MTTQHITDKLRNPRRMLTNINWKETSGVDHPANETEGWLVMKGSESDQNVLAKLLEEEQEHVRKSGELFKILSTMDLGDAPDAVRESGKTIVDWLKEEGYQVENAVHKPGEDDDEDEEERLRRRGKKDQMDKEDEADKAGHKDDKKQPMFRASKRKQLIDALLRVMPSGASKSEEPEEDPAEKALEKSLPVFLQDVKNVMASGTGDKKEGLNKAMDNLETAVSEKIAA